MEESTVWTAVFVLTLFLSVVVHVVCRIGANIWELLSLKSKERDEINLLNTLMRHPAATKALDQLKMESQPVLKELGRDTITFTVKLA